MKSFQILENVPVEEQSEYSELQVLQSAAGYYIGTIHTDPDGFQEPGSRDSHYFQTKEAAQEALNELVKIYDETKRVFSKYGIKSNI